MNKLKKIRQRQKDSCSDVCPLCKGTGTIIEKFADPHHGHLMEMRVPCPKCQGEDFNGPN